MYSGSTTLTISKSADHAGPLSRIVKHADQKTLQDPSLAGHTGAFECNEFDFPHQIFIHECPVVNGVQAKSVCMADAMVVVVVLRLCVPSVF